ncbi:hypothetical protein RI129_000745 [Pyrocoelia pectoralis]|uniref:Condensin complex subunit 2 n=1 Tax=Pyrocoelia pectoralis TaxID=417401 RepID=A0AAN7ZWC7_9COLE
MSDVNQDENVRNVERRTIFYNPNRLSRIDQSLLPSDKEIKEHFQLCLKLYTENRINAKNVWNLKLIDYLPNVLTQEGNTLLQVAGTSLDVAAKIYGIRVDDVHSDGMRLVSNMLRVNSEQEPGNYYAFRNEHITNNNSQNQAKRNKARRKATISTNPESLLGDIPKLPSTSFQTQSDSSRNMTGNLLTNTIPIDHLGCTPLLLREEKWWQDYNVNKTCSKKKYMCHINKLHSFEICTPFSNFEIDEWDVDREEIDEINEGLDCENAALYELDGSLLNNLDRGNFHEIEQQVDGEVEDIVNFHPKTTGRLANDYSFTSAVKLNNNKVMDRVWAGPSHWKLKYLQPRCSSVTKIYTYINSNDSDRMWNVENVLRDKRTDMRELKKALWKILLTKVAIDQKQLFSEVYAKLPKYLIKKIRNNLTCALTFVSLLHVANEKNLKFEKIGDNDFTIHQQNQFVCEN